MLKAALLACPLLLLFTASARALPVSVGKDAIPRVSYPGMKTITYRYGPLQIKPGQGSIILDRLRQGPKIPGYVTRFEPNLVRASNNKPMPVDTIHIHHATWMGSRDASFFAGEEKTIIQYPKGFGIPVTGKEDWFLSYMLHNFTSTPEQIYLTWQIDFVPQDSAGARLIQPLSSHWLSVAGDYASGGANWPIFNALKGWGKNGKFTYPDQARGVERARVGADQKWTVPQDLTLVYTLGHMHPGALYSSLFATRDGKKRLLFRSRAKYFGSREPISYDMAVTGPTPGWRVKLKRGDVLSTNVTLDTSRNSWFESMGVMPVAYVDGHDAGGIDPFAPGARLPLKGRTTHGSLPENRNIGGQPTSLPDPRSLPDGPQVVKPIAIKGFRYQLGDYFNPGRASYPPVVRAGQPLSFVNLDAPRGARYKLAAYHTVTACRAPCSRTTGVTYPQADGRPAFDSGQLGFGPDDATPAAQRNTWSTPTGLSPGTYTYFCRIHPSMRGAFRVKPGSAAGVSTGWSPLPSGGGVDA